MTRYEDRDEDFLHGKDDMITCPKCGKKLSYDKTFKDYVGRLPRVLECTPKGHTLG